MKEFINLPKILIVEDDDNLAYFLRRFLKRNGYDAEKVSNGKEGISKLTLNNYDLLIVDIGLPQMNGFEVLKELRTFNPNLPAIVITDRISRENEVETFEVGANIFHKKPIIYEVLIAQVKSLIKSKQPSNTIRIGDLTIDLTLKRVYKNSKLINLTFNEFRLVLLLISIKGRVFSREEILNQILNLKRDSTSSAVDTLVSRLRKKLGDYNGEPSIETIYKSGYRFNLKYFED